MKIHALPLMLFAFAAVACTGSKDDSGSDTSAADGSDGSDGSDASDGEDSPVASVLRLSFEIDPDYRDVMDEPAVGNFWGDVYNADEVSSVGPDDGAVALAALYVANLDLTGDATDVLLETEEITAVSVVILGFLDSDANANPDSPGPDQRDPVTLPGQNRTDLVAGSTDVTVFFGLLNP
jgi:hypothetical protein